MKRSLRRLAAFVFCTGILVTGSAAYAAKPVTTENKVTEVTEVMIIGTLHGYHAVAKSYDFERLYSLVLAAKPDYVGVEIRPEDMGQDEAYLAKFYPPEMIREAQLWGPRAFGFDWLGQELAGRPVPDDWWSKQFWLKPLEQEMANDPAMQSHLSDMYGRLVMDILKIASPELINGGVYDDVVDLRHMERDRLSKGTKYQRLTDFYEMRDLRIGENVAAFIRAHPGKRILVLTGADHHGVLVHYIQENMKSDVKLLPVE